MFDFIDLTSGAITVVIAVLLRLLEAVWKEYRRGRKHERRRRMKQDARDTETFRTAMRENITVLIQRDDHIYSTSDKDRGTDNTTDATITSNPRERGQRNRRGQS